MKFTIVKMKIKTTRTSLLTVVLAGLTLGSNAQEVPTILSGATIHTGTGEVIQNGTLVMNQGKIMSIGAEPVNFIKNAKVIDVTGKHIYPGVFALNNIMGLNEIDAVRATRDFNEVGDFNPNVRSLIAYNTDSKILPTAFFNGILFTQPVPQGGSISGSSSLVYTKAWNWEDAAIAEDEGVHLNYPDFRPQHRPEEQERLNKELEAIRKFFEDAKQYNQQSNPSPVNLRLKAMKNVMEGKANLYIHTNKAKAILHAIAFFKTNYPEVKLVLVDAEEAWQVADELAKQKIPVILGTIHRLPSYPANDVDQPFKTPAQLIRKGVLVAISQTGSWESRNVMFNAGTCAAYGLTKEEALQLITLNAAKITGTAEKLGSLEKGKEASLLVVDGDLLDMRSSKIQRIFKQGEEQQLSNEQEALYKKYKEKYGLE